MPGLLETRAVRKESCGYSLKIAKRKSKMPNNKDLVLWVIAGVLAYFVFMGQPATTTVVNQPASNGG